MLCLNFAIGQMNKLDQLRLLFHQKINDLKSEFVSDFLWVQEVAKHEIFFHVVKQFITRGNELPTTSLIDVIVAQHEDFLLQVIGLLHLSDQFRGLPSLTKADLVIFTNFLLSNYNGIFVIGNDLVRLADESCMPDLETFYKHKYFIDHTMVTEMYAHLILQRRNSSFDSNNQHYGSFYRMVEADEERSKLAQAYMATFAEHVDAALYECQKDELEGQLDRQLAQAKLMRQSLWKEAKPKLQALNKNHANRAKGPNRFAPKSKPDPKTSSFQKLFSNSPGKDSHIKGDRVQNDSNKSKEQFIKSTIKTKTKTFSPNCGSK